MGKEKDNETKIEDINNQMLDIYNSFKESNKQNNSNSEIENITYFQNLTLINPKDEMGIGEEEVFVVKIKDDQEQEIYAIYSDGNLIAIVDENGFINLMEEYIEQLKMKDERFALILEKKEDEELFKLPEELSEDDILKTKEELEEMKEKSEKDDNAKDEKEEDDNGKELSAMAEEIGIEEEELKSCATLNTNQEVTKTETIKDIVPESEEFDNIAIIRSKKSSNKKDMFYIIGKNKDGSYKKLETLGGTEGVNTDKTITSINYDGSTVKEKQVGTMMPIAGRPNEYISVNIGNYGIIETDYIRRSTKGEYIGSQIETNTVKPTKVQVREFMDRTKNKEIDDNISKAENYETSEKGTLNDIKDNVFEDNEIITYTSGYTRTVEEISAELGISPREFKERYSKFLDAGCKPEMAVEIIRDDIIEEKEDNGDKGERPTPEEMANKH